MSFSVTAPAGALAKAFSMAARVSPRAGSSVPIMSNLRLAGRGGKLVIGGRNNDAKIEIGLDVTARGEVTAPADKLAAIASRLDTEKPLTLVQTDTVMTASQGRSRFTLPTMPADQLPLDMTDKVEGAFEVESAVIIAALKAIEGAAETDMLTKAYLCGAYLDFKEPTPKLVTASLTSLAAAPLTGRSPEGASMVIIPPTAFPIIQALAALTPTLKLSVAKFMFAVTAGDIRYETKVIDGNFPDWRRLVRTEHATHVTVDGPVLRRALERLTAIGLANVVVSFGDAIEIEATASKKSDNAGADDVIDCVEMTGPHQRVVLASDNLAWAAASLPGASSYVLGIENAERSISVSDPARPAEVRLIMPLRG